MTSRKNNVLCNKDHAGTRARARGRHSVRRRTSSTSQSGAISAASSGSRPPPSPRPPPLLGAFATAERRPHHTRSRAGSPLLAYNCEIAFKRRRKSTSCAHDEETNVSPSHNRAARAEMEEGQTSFLASQDRARQPTSTLRESAAERRWKRARPDVLYPCLARSIEHANQELLSVSFWVVSSPCSAGVRLLQVGLCLSALRRRAGGACRPSIQSQDPQQWAQTRSRRGGG